MAKEPKKKPLKGAKMKPGQKQHVQPGVLVTKEREKMWERVNAGLPARPYGNVARAQPKRVAPPKKTTPNRPNRPMAKKARKTTKKKK